MVLGDRKRTGIRYLMVIVLLLFASLVTMLPFRIVLVNGSSMYPSFKARSLVLLSLSDNDYRPNDVVVLRGNDGSIYMKRLIAEGLSTVIISEQFITVDGKPMDDPYAYYGAIKRSNTVPEGTFQVPEGSWFVMGDNRFNSFDSRYAQFGTIKEKSIIGKVIF